MSTSTSSGAPRKAKDKMVRVYVPTPILEELLVERRRLERPISWILQRAWMISRDRIRAMREEQPPTAANGQP